MRLFLGVDGGQSGTTAMIGDETGRILGSGEAGPCNHAAAGEGRSKLESAIAGSLAGACAEAGLDPANVEFEAACLGMSGGPEDKREILANLLRTKHLLVTTDAAVALAGAMNGGQGIIVIAGTGSIAFGRDDSGRTARAGGWGYIFGDEGSAFDIARQALRAALRADEGSGPPTNLRDLLLQATETESANQALHLFYTPDWPRSRVAGLAQVVDTAAKDGDAVALEILTRAAQDLAMLAAAVRRQLRHPAEMMDVAYIGGVFQSEFLLDRFRTLIELDEARCRPPQFGPVEGALLEAWSADGLHPAIFRADPKSTRHSR
jgi:N-acetylglucosamine kinase-like BadF-type ATPase